MVGMTISARSATATAEAIGQSRAWENSSEITRPIIDYVRSLRTDNPRDVVIVYVPEYVVGHWWEQILHNQSALRLRVRLHFIPGVMVASVPWQLRSSEGQDDDDWADRPVGGRAGNVIP